MSNDATRDEAFRLSRTAKTAADHINAAQQLLGLSQPSAIYVMTPVTVSMAQVHATLAVAVHELGGQP